MSRGGHDPRMPVPPRTHEKPTGLRMPRLGAASLAGIWMLLSPAIASSASQSGREARPCPVVVKVGDLVREPARVEAHVHETICRTLEEHDVDRDRTPRSIVVDVGGSGAQWQFSVSIAQDGELVPESIERGSCRCDLPAMSRELTRATVAVVPLLRAQTGAPQDEAGMPPVAEPPSVREAVPAPLGAQGRAGIALLSVGAAGTFVGIALVASGSQPAGGGGGSRALQPSGYALLGVSLAVGVAGAVLLGLDRRSARRRPSVSVAAAPGEVGFVLRGRF